MKLYRVPTCGVNEVVSKVRFTVLVRGNVMWKLVVLNLLKNDTVLADPPSFENISTRDTGIDARYNDNTKVTLTGATASMLS